MKLWHWALILSIVSMILLTACAKAPPAAPAAPAAPAGPSAASSADVIISSSSIQPGFKQVSVGSSVSFGNTNEKISNMLVKCSISGTSYSVSQIKPGEAKSIMFEKEGSFACITIPGTKKMTVQVGGEVAEAAP